MFCISNKVLGGTDTAGLGTTLCNSLVQRVDEKRWEIGDREANQEAVVYMSKNAGLNSKELRS